MYTFRVSVHGHPTGGVDWSRLHLDGCDYNVLLPSPAQVAAQMAVSFEAAYHALAALPRMFIELDGSFVWVAAPDAPAWQVDGYLYDRNERLMFVDLKGCCPEGPFDQLLGAFGWPQTALMFQLTEHALFFDETEFRRYASQSARP